MGGQVVAEGGLQHPAAGQVQLELLIAGHAGVGGQNLAAGRHQAAVQLQFQPFHLLPQVFLVGDQPRIQAYQKAVLHGAQAGFHLGAGGRACGIVEGPLLVDLFGGAGQRVAQALGGQVHLDQIVHHPGLDGPAGVAEILRAGQHDKNGQGAFFVAGVGQGQPVHHRHFDVGNDDVGLFPLDELLGDPAVAGGAADGVAQLFPFEHPLQADQDQGFVVSQ